MADAHWKVGTVTVPSSTGTQAVTGLGGTPKAVFFFGTNWLTEDAAVTTAHTSVFRGMAAPKFDDPGTIINSASTLTPAGEVFHQAASPTNSFCIEVLDQSGVLAGLYNAGCVSFDADGFTLNWVVAASGGYKIVYVALMDSTALGYIGNGSVSLGFKAGASLYHTAAGGPDVGATGRNMQMFGGAAYPGSSSGGWISAAMACHNLGSGPGAQQYVFLDSAMPDILAGTTSTQFGPFLVTNDAVVYPTGMGLTDFNAGFAAGNGGMVVAWDDEDAYAGITTPGASEDDTATVSGLAFSPGLLIGYALSDEQATTPPNGHGAAGFFVVTEDFQWCALIDGVNRGSYQSFQRGFCDSADITDFHAGTIRLTSDGFVMTTVEDSFGVQPVAWNAFGHPSPGSWIPHVYRRESG